MKDTKRPGASGRAMKVTMGRVVDGKVELDDELTEGTAVVVFAPNSSDLPLTAAEEEELSEAFNEIRDGCFEDGFALLREIKNEAGR